MKIVELNRNSNIKVNNEERYLEAKKGNFGVFLSLPNRELGKFRASFVGWDHETVEIYVPSASIAGKGSMTLQVDEINEIRCGLDLVDIEFKGE